MPVDPKKAKRSRVKELFDDQLADHMAEWGHSDEESHIAHTEFVYRQTSLQRKSLSILERGAKAQERAADAQVSAANSMKFSMWAMVVTAICTFAVALASYIALLSK